MNFFEGMRRAFELNQLKGIFCFIRKKKERRAVTEGLKYKSLHTGTVDGGDSVGLQWTIIPFSQDSIPSRELLQNHFAFS